MSAEGAVKGLIELSAGMDEIVFHTMQPENFNNLLAKIYSFVIGCLNSPHTSDDALKVAALACRLVERILAFHLAENIDTTTKVISTFDATVGKLEGIVRVDGRVGQEEFDDAVDIRHFLGAVAASGRFFTNGLRPMYSGRYEPDEQEARRDLEHASANIVKYTRFIIDGLGSAVPPSNPFIASEKVLALNLYQRVLVLKSHQLRLS